MQWFHYLFHTQRTLDIFNWFLYVLCMGTRHPFTRFPGKSFCLYLNSLLAIVKIVIKWHIPLLLSIRSRYQSYTSCNTCAIFSISVRMRKENRKSNERKKIKTQSDRVQLEDLLLKIYWLHLILYITKKKQK